MEVAAPQLRKPRVVINNVPNNITVGNLEEVIISQNPELELVQEIWRLNSCTRLKGVKTK